MAATDQDVLLTVDAVTAPFERSVQNAVNKVNNIKLQLDTKGFALGRITGEVSEFRKSLEASNARVIAFGASAGLITKFTQAFRGMVEATIEVQKELTGLNTILNVSNKQLTEFGSNLFKVAGQTGQSFKVVTEAATELARQGLGVEETLKRTRDALILTRLTGMDAASSVEALTAAVNSYRKEALDTTTIINKLATVDAAFAVSSKDLAEAIRRVGSTAQEAGVNFDQLIAIVTSAQQTTARGGAVIGNALKTIFTRLERSSTLDELEKLGIAVRDVEGKTRPVIDILAELARTYDGLSESQKSTTSELVGGVFQINILKSVMGDLNREFSIYNQALKTSSGSTDEAVRRNEALNKTLAAQANLVTQQVTEAAAKIGKLSLEPAIKRILGTTGSIANFISGNLGGEDAGTKIGEGILKGIGNVLSGPGLIVGGALLFKLVERLGKFSIDAAKGIIQLGNESQKRAVIEEQIIGLLKSEDGLYSKIFGDTKNVARNEQIILDILKQQNQVRQQQQQYVTRLATGLLNRGVSVDNRTVNLAGAKAGGYIPNFEDASSVEAASVRAGVGGANPSSSVVNKTIRMDDGTKRVAVNSSEKIVRNFMGSGKDAVINPIMERQMGPLDNYGSVERIAANGFIPNFVKNLPSQRTDLLQNRAQTKSELKDVQVHGVISSVGINNDKAPQILKNNLEKSISQSVNELFSHGPKGIAPVDSKGIIDKFVSTSAINNILGNIFETVLRRGVSQRAKFLEGNNPPQGNAPFDFTNPVELKEIVALMQGKDAGLRDFNLGDAKYNLKSTYTNQSMLKKILRFTDVGRTKISNYFGNQLKTSDLDKITKAGESYPLVNQAGINTGKLGFTPISALERSMGALLPKEDISTYERTSRANKIRSERASIKRGSNLATLDLGVLPDIVVLHPGKQGVSPFSLNARLGNRDLGLSGLFKAGGYVPNFVPSLITGAGGSGKSTRAEAIGGISIDKIPELNSKNYLEKAKAAIDSGAKFIHDHDTARQLGISDKDFDAVSEHILNKDLKSNAIVVVTENDLSKKILSRELFKQSQDKNYKGWSIEGLNLPAEEIKRRREARAFVDSPENVRLRFGRSRKGAYSAGPSELPITVSVLNELQRLGGNVSLTNPVNKSLPVELINKPIVEAAGSYSPPQAGHINFLNTVSERYKKSFPDAQRVIGTSKYIRDLDVPLTANERVKLLQAGIQDPNAIYTKLDTVTDSRQIGLGQIFKGRRGSEEKVFVMGQGVPRAIRFGADRTEKGGGKGPAQAREIGLQPIEVEAGADRISGTKVRDLIKMAYGGGLTPELEAQIRSSAPTSANLIIPKLKELEARKNRIAEYNARVAPVYDARIERIKAFEEKVGLKGMGETKIAKLPPQEAEEKLALKKRIQATVAKLRSRQKSSYNQPRIIGPELFANGYVPNFARPINLTDPRSIGVLSINKLYNKVIGALGGEGVALGALETKRLHSVFNNAVSQKQINPNMSEGELFQFIKKDMGGFNASFSAGGRNYQKIRKSAGSGSLGQDTNDITASAIASALSRTSGGLGLALADGYVPNFLPLGGQKIGIIPLGSNKVLLKHSASGGHESLFGNKELEHAVRFRTEESQNFIRVIPSAAYSSTGFSFSQENKQAIIEALKDSGKKIIFANLPKLPVNKTSLPDAASGYIPNFADALSEAVSREHSAGIPLSQIMVGSNPQLKSSGNPAGLGVYNKRHEPQGLGQGIRRAFAEGLNPKTYGVPNFAVSIPNEYNLSGVNPQALSAISKASQREVNRLFNTIKEFTNATKLTNEDLNRAAIIMEKRESASLTKYAERGQRSIQRQKDAVALQNKEEEKQKAAAEKQARSDRLGSRLFQASFAASFLGGAASSFTQDPSKQRAISGFSNALGTAGTLASFGGPVGITAGVGIGGFQALTAIIGGLSKNFEELAQKSQELSSRDQERINSVNNILQAESNYEEALRGGDQRVINQTKLALGQAQSNLDPAAAIALRGAKTQADKEKVLFDLQIKAQAEERQRALQASFVRQEDRTAGFFGADRNLDKIPVFGRLLKSVDSFDKIGNTLQRTVPTFTAIGGISRGIGAFAGGASLKDTIKEAFTIGQPKERSRFEGAEGQRALQDLTAQLVNITDQSGNRLSIDELRKTIEENTKNWNPEDIKNLTRSVQDNKAAIDEQISENKKQEAKRLASAQTQFEFERKNIVGESNRNITSLISDLAGQARVSSAQRRFQAASPFLSESDSITGQASVQSVVIQEQLNSSLRLAQRNAKTSLISEQQGINSSVLKRVFGEEIDKLLNGNEDISVEQISKLEELSRGNDKLINNERNDLLKIATTLREQIASAQLNAKYQLDELKKQTEAQKELVALNQRLGVAGGVQNLFDGTQTQGALKQIADSMTNGIERATQQLNPNSRIARRFAEENARISENPLDRSALLQSRRAERVGAAEDLIKQIQSTRSLLPGLDTADKLSGVFGGNLVNRIADGIREKFKFQASEQTAGFGNIFRGTNLAQIVPELGNQFEKIIEEARGSGRFGGALQFLQSRRAGASPEDQAKLTEMIKELTIINNTQVELEKSAVQQAESFLKTENYLADIKKWTDQGAVSNPLFTTISTGITSTNTILTDILNKMPLYSPSINTGQQNKEAKVYSSEEILQGFVARRLGSSSSQTENTLRNIYQNPQQNAGELFDQLRNVVEARNSVVSKLEPGGISQREQAVIDKFSDTILVLQGILDRMAKEDPSKFVSELKVSKTGELKVVLEKISSEESAGGVLATKEEVEQLQKELNKLKDTLSSGKRPNPSTPRTQIPGVSFG